MSGQSTGVLARLRQPVELRRSPRQTIGGAPQVSLLPAEVRQAGMAAIQRRKLVAVVVVAVAAAVAAVGVAHDADQAAQARLATASQQAQMLNAEVGKFADVRRLQTRIALGKAAVSVGSSTMIDWNAQVDAIEAGKPAGYAVTNISANGATPFAAYPQGTSLLEPLRAATVEIKMTSPTVGAEFSSWIADLQSIPAYADATATTNYDTSSSLWSIDLTVHLTPKAIAPGAWKDQS
ncbi:MAG: hypothetical protein HIU86_11675 [Acidobacteria bacterium]|nr:hypothetical protein [Acidobacteriota bacterium]